MIEQAGTDEIKPGSDIFHDVGMIADDFHEMIEKYSKQFSVDMTDYLWYFHADEEGSRNSFIKAPYELVKRIPVTPALLTEFANTGKWHINYPEHKLPKRRYDLLMNAIVAGLILIGIIIWSIIKNN